MKTVLNRDSIKVKRDLQKRVENWVAEYCDALEENFKQYSINSYRRNIDNPTEVSLLYIKEVNLCGLLLQYSILFNLTVK